MKKLMKYSIVLPNDYYTNTVHYHPVYLFHGMNGGNNSGAVNGNVKEVLQNAFNNEEAEPMNVVMPDTFNILYFDGYESGSKYETYFGDEFFTHYNAAYRVSATRETLFIAGLSMRGFGASYYAFTHPNKFTYCYSMSSALKGVSSTTSPSILGITVEYGFFEDLPGNTFDCGFSYLLVCESNQSVHEALNTIGFEYEYMVCKGVMTGCFGKNCSKWHWNELDNTLTNEI